MRDSISLPTAGNILSDRKFSPKPSDDEIGKRFTVESTRIDLVKTGLTKAGETGLDPNGCKDLEVDKIPCVLSSTSKESGRSVIVWPKDTQSSYGYTPEYTLFETGDDSKCTISDRSSKTGEHTFLSRETVTHSTAPYFNRELNPSRPFKPGDTVIRTLRHKQGEPSKEEVLSPGQYLARTLSI